jgi:apolipoprotein N-acyltransferase
VDLIVWPESPAPFFLNDARFVGTVEGVAQRANTYVIAGSIGLKNVQAAPGERPYKLLNSAVLISPAGVMEARYDKLHLVPFGEYVPFQSLLVFAQKLTKESGDFVSGTERKVFDAGGQRIGTFICYESIFPDEVREFARNGAQVFVNISNDGWFGETGAPEQHLNMARMRAVENGRWLLRGTNTGITASIDPYGRVVARVPRNTRVALQAPYALETGTTFYTRHGDWFAYLCAIITLAALFMRFRIQSRGVR